MWKPRLTLPVLEAPAKKRSFLDDSGQAMPLPSQRISKEVSWVGTFQERGYWEQGACLQREPVGVACPPWPMSCAAFTCHNPGQALATPP